MPASGSMTLLPDPVKGSLVIEETEGTYTDFFTETRRSPVKTVKTQEGDTTVTAQFYDMTYATLAIFKGGTAPTAGGFDKFVPSTGYTDVNKAIEITFASGDVMNIFNANCSTRIIGAGGRDKMFMWEIKAKVNLTADLSGDAEYSKAQ